MDRFHAIQDAAAIIVSKSVYKQVPVYSRGKALYIGAAGGFVRLYVGGNTGLPNIRWDELEIPGIAIAAMDNDTFGKLSLPPTYRVVEGGRR